MNVFDLVASITLDSSQYERGLGQAQNTANSLGGAIAGGLGKAAQLAGGAIAAASTAVVGFGAASIKTGMDFDSSMSQVAATMGKTTEEVKDLRDFAQQMGASTAFSATEAADALNYMALAGYDAETSMKMLPTVLDLAAAGGMDLASASDMVTDTQSALGLTLEDTTKMVDQMAKTSSKTNTSVAQLGEAMLTIGATARGVKGGTVELSQVLGVLADNGIKSAEGGTHLRNAILSLQTPTKSGREALEKLGMSYEDMYDSAGNMRSLPEIFLELQHKMEGMTQASKDAIIGGLFNKTDLAAINALVGTSAERWGQLEKEITDSSGAAQDMAKTQLDNLNGDIIYMKSALEGVQNAVSEKLTPDLRNFVKLGTKGLSDMTGAIKSGDLNSAINIFSDILTQGLNKIIEGLPKVIDTGIKITGALAQGIAQNLPTLGNAALQVLEMLGNYITKYAPVLIAQIPSLLAEFTSGFRDNLGTVLEIGLNIVKAIAQGITDSLPEIAANAPLIIEDLLMALIENAPKILQAGIEIARSLITGIQENFPTFKKNMIEMFERVGEALTSVDWLALGSELIELIVTGLQVKSEIIWTTLQEVATRAVEFLKSVDWQQVGSDVIELIKQGISVLQEEIPKLLEDIGNNAGSLMESVDWGAVGQTIINAIGEGIKFVVENVPKLLREIAEKGREWFNNVDWVKLGSDVISLILKGITFLLENIPTLIQSIGNTAAEWMRNIDWKQVGYDLMTFILNAVKFMFYDLPNTLREIGFEAVRQVSEIDWFTLGVDIVNGIIQGVQNLRDTLIDTVSDMAEGAWDAVKDFFDINSPSKKMMWMGEMIDKGLQKGIEDSADLVSNAMDDLSVMPEISTSSFDAKGTALGNSENATSNTSNNNVVINVYGAAGQDINELAEIIEQKITAATRRREGAFA